MRYEIEYWISLTYFFEDPFRWTSGCYVFSVRGTVFKKFLFRTKIFRRTYFFRNIVLNRALGKKQNLRCNRVAISKRDVRPGKCARVSDPFSQNDARKQMPLECTLWRKGSTEANVRRHNGFYATPPKTLRTNQRIAEHDASLSKLRFNVLFVLPTAEARSIITENYFDIVFAARLNSDD